MVIDTLFTASADNSRTAAPVINAGKPGTVNLLPSGWGVSWTVKKGASGNGFDELVKAHKILNDAAGGGLLVKSKSAIVRGGSLNDAAPVPALSGNVISLPIGTAYTSGFGRIAKGGSVNL
jgi:hypothetical protein